MNQPVNANLDAGSACTVFERIDPVKVGFGLFYAHGISVAYKLRLSTREMM